MTANATFNRKRVLRSIKEYLIITFGLLCYSFAWTGVVIPAKIVGGGVTGMSLLIYYATGAETGGIPLGYSIFAINAILIVIATMLIGFNFSTKTIYAVIVMSLTMGFMQEHMPQDLFGTLPQDNKLLVAILGGAVAGLGIAICFSQGGSTGGTDIIAMIVNKFYRVSYGKVIMACDIIIIGLSYFIGHGIETVILSYVVVGVTGFTLDAVMAGQQASAQMMIISERYEKIADKILAEVNRGVTVLDGKGWYTKSPSKVLMVVCRKNETNTVLRIVKEVDPQAFVTSANVSSVFGRGFEALKESKKKEKTM